MGFKGVDRIHVAKKRDTWRCQDGDILSGSIKFREFLE
jgi:hypothetical protein